MSLLSFALKMLLPTWATFNVARDKQREPAHVLGCIMMMLLTLSGEWYHYCHAVPEAWICPTDAWHTRITCTLETVSKVLALIAFVVCAYWWLLLAPLPPNGEEPQRCAQS